MERAKVTAIILSGGKGTRLNSDIPKQYIKVKNRAVITYSLEIFANHPDIDSFVIVATDEWQEFILEEMRQSGIPVDKFFGFAEPGENRQLSVYNALEKVIEATHDDELNVKAVMIHDAARPCISSDLITRLIEAYDGFDGVMPASPMNNTMYVSSDGKSITGLLERGHIFAGHTPEMFDLKNYYEANKALLPDKIKTINGSSEPAVMAGMKIAMIENDEANFKITTNADLERFRTLIEKK